LPRTRWIRLAGDGRRGNEEPSVADAVHRPRGVTAALRAAAAAGAALLIAACGSTARPAQPAGAVALSASSATITETGSSLLAPQFQAWATAYEHANPGVTVNVVSSTSGTGIAAAKAGSKDIGASDAYLTSGDVVQSPTLLNIALAVSAQTVIYNLPGVEPAGTHVNLDGTVLAMIYSGAITKWDDSNIAALNKGVTLPPTPIVPLERSGSSGDTFLFTSYLSTQDATWDNTLGYGTSVVWPHVPGARLEASSTTMLTDCEAIVGCIGYNGISFLSKAIAGNLGYAALLNSVGNPELPTDATAIAAAVGSFVALTPPNETISMINGPATNGYPIVNYEYAVVKSVQPDAAKASALRAFLHWIITTGNDGSNLNDGYGFQPLSASLVTLGEQQIAEIH
jgi:phosphate transport system substrate-binding protein